MDVFLSIAVMYGITFGIKDSKLLRKPRQWLADRSSFFADLLSCPYCVGFHSGWLTFLLLRQDLSLLSGVGWVYLVAYSFAGVTVSGLLDALLLRLESSDKAP